MKIYEVVVCVNDGKDLSDFYFTKDLEEARAYVYSCATYVKQNFDLNSLKKGQSYIYIMESETDKPIDFFNKLNTKAYKDLALEEKQFCDEYDLPDYPKELTVVVDLTELSEFEYEYLLDFVFVLLTYIGNELDTKQKMNIYAELIYKVFKRVPLSKEAFKNNLIALVAFLDTMAKNDPYYPVNSLSSCVEKMTKGVPFGPYITTSDGREVSVSEILKGVK